MPLNAQKGVKERLDMGKWRMALSAALEALKRPFLAFRRQRKTYSLAIVRRYADANGSYVGELYLLGSFMGTLQYSMIGVSLDTLPFNLIATASFELDTRNDFLVPMPKDCVRVGAQDPQDNDAVRANVARLAREGKLTLQIQNRFIERVLGRP